ncbi:MAG: gliding motility lipoprotein GldH [Cytophagaceae bacterium]|nr:gliding motility lipoprotein GldH [Cytophagaceae bacterium]
MKNLTGCFLVALAGWLVGCDTNAIFNDNVDIPEGKWFVKQVPSFGFDVSDTTARYNVFYNVRNGRAYPYYNLYLTRYLYNAQGKLISKKLDQLFLADATTGKPLGTGLGDLYDHKILALPAYQFPAAGRYTVKIEQYMRQNPLPDVYSVGIAVEKIPPSTP